jgi:DNA-binding NtrC family response regulator
MTGVIRSEAMRTVMTQAERAAKTNAAVLITGESGSGKELVARAIHHYSLRCSKPWVDVSCAALPEHLMESELFGYEKGAFSGADSPKQGLFELAHTGTLFLDEIAELEPRMQVKLLRVLDGAPYYRLGGVKKVIVDVRLIAATNQDLEAAVANGKFRNDLYHRLNQIHITVPPLRRRGEEIQALAHFLLEEINPAMSFTQAALEALTLGKWPGNIREMKNTILRAATFAENNLIDLHNLPAEFQVRPAIVEEALTRTEGHCQRAADLLGISRRTLTRKMKSYRMEVEDEEADEDSASASPAIP